MKKIIFSLFVAAIFLFSLNSCYYDTESLLYPTAATCDTTNITYSVTIKNILQNNSCIACHSGTAAAGGNIILDNYNSVNTYAANGKLYGSINHDPGYIAMPQGGNKLTSCDIKKVKIWIIAGMQNN
ncbi:MAG: hypothetical protein ACHQF0_17060 [Chitinophagales bacterium]